MLFLALGGGGGMVRSNIIEDWVSPGALGLEFTALGSGPSLLWW